MITLESPVAAYRVDLQCQKCWSEFCLITSNVSCPSCGSKDLGQMVVIYADDDVELAEMMTAADIGAGD